MKKIFNLLLIAISLSLCAWATAPALTMGEIISPDDDGTACSECQDITPDEVRYGGIAPDSIQGLFYSKTAHSGYLADTWYCWNPGMQQVIEFPYTSYLHAVPSNFVPSDTETPVMFQGINYGFSAVTAYMSVYTNPQDTSELWYCHTTGDLYVAGRWYLKATPEDTPFRVFYIEQGVACEEPEGVANEVVYYGDSEFVYGDNLGTSYYYTNTDPEAMPQYLRYYFTDDGDFQAGHWYNGVGQEIPGGVWLGD